MTSMRDGWRNDATAQVAEQIQEDPLLLLEAIDRINHHAVPYPGRLSWLFG
jgi:hypothetical protein